MAEPTITLDQLKTLGITTVDYYRQLPPPGKNVRIRTPTGQSYVVKRVGVSRRGEHVILGDGSESVILRTRSLIVRATQVAAAGVGLIASVVALVSVLTPQPSPDIAKRIGELPAVQQSLRDLERYVEGQRSALQHISSDIQRLQHEKATLARAAELDRTRVESLLEYQAAGQRRREWLSVALSFVIGVLSSVTAALVLGVVRRSRRRPDEQNEPA